MKSSGEMTIGELAGKFGLATHVLRHWEAMGLLSPAPRVNGRRRYRDEHVRAVALILVGKQAGFTLEEIRALHAAPDRDTRRALLRAHEQTLRRRIEVARAQLRLVRHGLECKAHDTASCPNLARIVDGLTRDTMRWPVDAVSHASTA